MNFIDLILYPFYFEVSSLNLGIYRFLFFLFFLIWQISNFKDLKLILKNLNENELFIRRKNFISRHLNENILYFSIAACLMCILGIFGNLSILIFSILFLSIIGRVNHFIGTTGDVILRAILFFLLSSPCSFSFSLDSLIFTGSLINEKIEMVPGASVLSIRYMLILMYAYSSFAKINDANWINGKIMGLATSSPLYGKNNFLSKLFEKKEIQIASSRMIIYYQYLAIAFLQFQDTRIFYAIFGMFLHLGMAASMNLGYFPYIMVLGLFSFLI